MRRDDRTSITGRGIKTDAETSSSPKSLDNAEIRSKIILWIFGCNPGLDGVSTQFNIFLAFDIDLRVLEFITLCNTYLGLNQVTHGHQLGHSMLNLNTRIDFDEIKTPTFVHKEFYGSGIYIINRFSNFQCVATKFLTFLLCQIERWCNFNNFLMATLNRAVPLVEVNQITVLVAKNLDFNMFRVFNIFFKKYGCITESSFCL